MKKNEINAFFSHQTLELFPSTAEAKNETMCCVFQPVCTFSWRRTWWFSFTVSSFASGPSLKSHQTVWLVRPVKLDLRPVVSIKLVRLLEKFLSPWYMRLFLVSVESTEPKRDSRCSWIFKTYIVLCTISSVRTLYLTVCRPLSPFQMLSCIWCGIDVSSGKSVISLSSIYR